MKEYQNFVLRVFSEPKSFELMYVEELLMIYEIYFQSVRFCHIYRIKALPKLFREAELVYCFVN